MLDFMLVIFSNILIELIIFKAREQIKVIE